MGKLIGMKVDVQTKHPQDLVDALYEEIFDHYPADQEVDVALLVRSTDLSEDGADANTIEVLDAIVCRVGDDVKLGDWGPRDDAVPMFKAIDAWARERRPEHQNGDDHIGYIFMHKHPEGMDYPSPKDIRVLNTLNTIDYARSTDEHRTFNLMAVINRYQSTAMGAARGRVVPIHDLEIDLAAEDRMWREVTDGRIDLNDPRWVRLIGLREKFREFMVQKQEFVDRDDRAGFEALYKEFEPQKLEMHRLLAELIPADAEPDLTGDLLGNIPPEIAAIISRIAGLPGATMLPGSGPLAGGFVIRVPKGTDGLLGMPPAIQPPSDPDSAKKSTTDAIMRAFGVTPEPTEEVAEPEPEPTGRPAVPEAFDLPEIEWLD